MRIVLVTGLVAGGVGGHVRQLTGLFTERGHEVVVACPPEVAERFELAAAGARIVPIRVGTTGQPLADLATVRTLRRLTREEGSANGSGVGVAAGVDVVHAHGLRAAALAALAVPRRTPLVVTSHNGPPPGTAAGLVYRALEQVACRRADVVLGVSPDLVERARRAGARRTGLAQVPAEPTGRPAPAVRDDARRRIRADLGLAVDVPLVVSVGRLAAQKRLDVLVRAFHDVVARDARDRAAPTLVIAGDGPERARLESLATDGPGRVVLAGRVDHVPELLLAADLAVSSARWEGQPLWLQEALAAGVPVVATDVGGTGVVLGGAGILVPDDTPGGVGTALGEAVHTVLTDPELASDLSRRARERAAELVTPEAAADALITLYASSAR